MQIELFRLLTHHGRTGYASCFLIGRLRIRLPVAAKIALQIAGDIGGTPGSPTPAGGAELGTIWMCVSTGASLMRATGYLSKLDCCTRPLAVVISPISAIL